MWTSRVEDGEAVPPNMMAVGGGVWRERVVLNEEAFTLATVREIWMSVVPKVSRSKDTSRSE